MSNIVNLNRTRKAKTRKNARERADENAVKFGRTKGEKAIDAQEAKALAKTLDDAKRDP